jgi:hypothetical protein
VIVLASPGGLVGIWESLWDRRKRRLGPTSAPGIPAMEVVDDAVDHPAAV